MPFSLYLLAHHGQVMKAFPLLIIHLSNGVLILQSDLCRFLNIIDLFSTPFGIPGSIDQQIFTKPCKEHLDNHFFCIN